MVRRKSSILWMRERSRDQYYRLAKERGYRSRAAFKLLQAARSQHFIKLGDRVVDLGAAPGGWLQVSRQLVENRGYVLGLDLKPIKPFPWKNVETLIGDVADESIVERIREKTGGKVDVILSDLSPNITGIWEMDHARQIYLAEKALNVAKSILKCRGNLFAKIFHGSEVEEFRREVEKYFSTVKFLKPKASRARSSEVYILARGYIAQPDNSPARLEERSDT